MNWSYIRAIKVEAPSAEIALASGCGFADMVAIDGAADCYLVKDEEGDALVVRAALVGPSLYLVSAISKAV